MEGEGSECRHRTVGWMRKKPSSLRQGVSRQERRCQLSIKPHCLGPNAELASSQWRGTEGSSLNVPGPPYGLHLVPFCFAFSSPDVPEFLTCIYSLQETWVIKKIAKERRIAHSPIAVNLVNLLSIF